MSKLVHVGVTAEGSPVVTLTAIANKNRGPCATCDRDILPGEEYLVEIIFPQAGETDVTFRRHKDSWCGYSEED